MMDGDTIQSLLQIAKATPVKPANTLTPPSSFSAWHLQVQRALLGQTKGKKPNNFSKYNKTWFSKQLPQVLQKEDVPMQGSHHPTCKNSAGACRQLWPNQMVKWHSGMQEKDTPCCFHLTQAVLCNGSPCRGNCTQHGAPAASEVGKQGLAGNNQQADCDKLLKWCSGSGLFYNGANSTPYSMDNSNVYFGSHWCRVIPSTWPS